MTRRSRNNCCVVNCNSTYSNTEYNIKFYKFPARPWELERKQKWIRAVNRKETDGSPWIPKKGSLICSKHFVGGEKSNHPHNPAYLPTIFPNMPYKCSVPLCRSNYGDRHECSMFRFPRDEERRNQWIKAINRENYVPGPAGRVCIKHFEEHYVERILRAKRDDGSILEVPLPHPRLTKDAYPTVFSEQPEKQEPDALKTKKSKSNKCKDDEISSIDYFKTSVHSKVPNEKWRTMLDKDNVCVYMLEFKDGGLSISKSLNINSDLKVELKIGNNAINYNVYKHILRSTGKCDMWTKFDRLLNFLMDCGEQTEYNKLENIISNYSKLCESVEDEIKCKQKSVKDQPLSLASERIRCSKQMGNPDVLVCGQCHSVFHLIEEFMEHRDSVACSGKSPVRDCMEPNYRVWAFILWKCSSAVPHYGVSRFWNLYRLWCKMEDSQRAAWIAAGRTLQYFTDLSNAKVIESQSSVPAENRVAKKTLKDPSANSDTEFFVEKILGKRFNPQTKLYEYLLKWEGFNYQHNSWEPSANVSQCQRLLDAFEKQLARQKERKALKAKQLEEEKAILSGEDLQQPFLTESRKNHIANCSHDQRKNKIISDRKRGSSLEGLHIKKNKKEIIKMVENLNQTESKSDSDDDYISDPFPTDLSPIPPPSPVRELTLCPLTGKRLARAEGEPTPSPTPPPLPTPPPPTPSLLPTPPPDERQNLIMTEEEIVENKDENLGQCTYLIRDNGEVVSVNGIDGGKAITVDLAELIQMTSEENYVGGDQTITEVLQMNGDEEEDSHVLAQLVHADLPSPGGTRKVTFLLPDGSLEIAEVDNEQYLSIIEDDS